MPRYEPTAGDLLRQLPHRAYKDDEIADACKDFAYVIGAVRVTVTLHPAPDRWRTIEVSHASIFSEEPNDGWDVSMSETEL